MLFIALTYSFLASQIESLESELADLALSEFDRQIKLLTSIKEIGITLATALIVATGGFSYFDNAKQISRFIGICPTYQQSGTSVHIKGGINRNGDVSLRSLLYVASWSALRGNTTCKECYTRLKANGNSYYCCKQARQASICRNQIRLSLCGWICIYPANKIAYGGVFSLILLAD